MPRERLKIYDDATAPPASSPLAENNDALKDMLADATIGATIGTGLGALAKVIIAKQLAALVHLVKSAQAGKAPAG